MRERPRKHKSQRRVSRHSQSRPVSRAARHRVPKQTRKRWRQTGCGRGRRRGRRRSRVRFRRRARCICGPAGLVAWGLRLRLSGRVFPEKRQAVGANEANAPPPPSSSCGCLSIQGNHSGAIPARSLDLFQTSCRAMVSNAWDICPSMREDEIGCSGIEKKKEEKKKRKRD